MWQPGDVIAFRGIFRNRVWHAQSMIVVNEGPGEIVLALLPGSECMAPEGYFEGKQNGKRRWDFKEKDWQLEEFPWHTNRLLVLLQPHKYYATLFFWHATTGHFECYYINFQLPFRRSHCGIDTLDLDLDLIIRPDLNFEWKDLDDYQQAIDNNIISLEWIRGVEAAKKDVLEKLAGREYPFDCSWLDWLPDPAWSPASLPSGWEKI